MATLEKKKIMSDAEILARRKRAEEWIAELESKPMNKVRRYWLERTRQNLAEFDGTEHFAGIDPNTFDEIFNLGE